MGLIFWEYEEVGVFVDAPVVPEEIFFARFIDDGVAFEVHALAGVEIPMGRMTNLLFAFECPRFICAGGRLMASSGQRASAGGPE